MPLPPGRSPRPLNMNLASAEEIYGASPGHDFMFSPLLLSLQLSLWLFDTLESQVITFSSVHISQP